MKNFNKTLYESIMRNVKKSLNSILNESSNVYYVYSELDYDSDQAGAFSDDELEEFEKPGLVGGPYYTYEQAVDAAVEHIFWYLTDCDLVSCYYDDIEDDGIDINDDERVKQWLLEHNYIIKRGDTLWDDISGVSCSCKIIAKEF